MKTPEQLRARADELEARAERLIGADRNDMPGTLITGRSGVPAARIRQLHRQLDRSVDRAVEVSRLTAEATRLRAQAVYAEQAPERAQRAERVADMQAARFASIQVGDRIDVGGNDLLTVTRKNRVTVATGPDCLWRAHEIARVIKAGEEMPRRHGPVTS